MRQPHPTFLLITLLLLAVVPATPADGQVPLIRLGTSFGQFLPKNTLTLQAMVGRAVHVDAPTAKTIKSPHLQTFGWNFGDDDGAYNTLAGFNAAHVYGTPGIYTILFNGKPFATVKVTAAPDPTPVHSTAELAAVLAAGGSAQLPPGTLALSNTLVAAPGATVIGSPGGSSCLYWTGGNTSLVVNALQGGFTARNVTFDSTADTSATGLGPDAIRLGGSNNTVVGCRFANVRTAVLGNGAPDGTLVQDCLVNGTGDLAGYLVWVEGRRWTILGNRAPNSTRESPIRLSAVGSNANSELVLVAYNALANIERPGVDQYDAVKAAIKCEWVDYAWVENNVFDGMCEAGPLGDGDGLPSAWRRADYLVWRNNLHRGPVRLKHGLEHFLMENSRVDYLNGTVGGYTVAVAVEGVDAAYGRYSRDLTLRGNVITTPRRGERQVWVKGVVLDGLNFSRNSLIQGTSLVAATGKAAVAVDGGWQSDYASLNNIFPAPGYHGWPNSQAVAQVGSQNDPSAYLTTSQWLTLTRVQDDQFVNVPMP